MRNTQHQQHSPAGTTEWFQHHFASLRSTPESYHVVPVRESYGQLELDDDRPRAIASDLAEAQRCCEGEGDVVIARDDPDDEDGRVYLIEGLWMPRGDALEALR